MEIANFSVRNISPLDCLFFRLGVEAFRYVFPAVLASLLLWREPPSATLLQLVEVTYLPWPEQMERVFVDS